jgi:hypothetical protein
MIHASIPGVYRSLFDYQIVEGNNTGPTLASYQTHMMEFNLGTQVKLAWAYGMPTTGFSFTESTDAENLDKTNKNLVGKLECQF